MNQRQTAFFETSAVALYAERATYARRIHAIVADECRRAEVDGYIQLIDNINRTLIELSSRLSEPSTLGSR